MKVIFVLAFALVQGLALPTSDVGINIEISNLPSDIEIHLPGQIDAQQEVEISHLPGQINAQKEVEISLLPNEIELPSGIEIAHLPAQIDLPSGIEISHLPGVLPVAAESTPSCVKYVRTLLEEVLRALPGGQEQVERPYVPAAPLPSPVVENACTRCFQKIQLMIEQVNSKNSAALTF